MKYLAEKKALSILGELKAGYAEKIRTEFEHRAKSCITCTTPGACCLDAHFVNVHITRLEARAIGGVLQNLPVSLRQKVGSRIEKAIAEYGLSEDGDTFDRTYACPLFEPGIGCLAHGSTKPLPCIHHACYDRGEDLPPEKMLAEQERSVDRLNERVYGPSRWLPLPVALREAGG